ncbi:uncharacterized protein DS421_18g626250 [Arachis hypogaea]|nr:uncharacterized protein DS421_18g626250 [Arachis hypogaea]
MDTQDQPFIMVPNPNYVAPSVVHTSLPGSRLAASPEWTPLLPPSAQQSTILITTPPLAIYTAMPKSSHRS